MVPLSGIPNRVRNAVIAIEDDRFYQHEGVDFRGIARATTTVSTIATTAAAR